MTLTMLRRSAILLPHLIEIDERNLLATRTSLAARRRCNPSLHDTTTLERFIGGLDNRFPHFVRNSSIVPVPNQTLGDSAAESPVDECGRRFLHDRHSSLRAIVGSGVPVVKRRRNVIAPPGRRTLRVQLARTRRILAKNETFIHRQLEK
jgi:hypothetical protein